MKVHHRSTPAPVAAAPVAVAPVAAAPAKPARTGASKHKAADQFSLKHSRQVVRQWFHLQEPRKTKPATMDAATGAAVGGAACLAILCSPVIAVLSIVCLPCIGCCVGASAFD